MVDYVATGIIFAVLESPKSFTGTRHVRSCLIIILDIAAREHPRAGSKQMATYRAVVAQTQSSSSSSNLCCSVATQTSSAHHVACSLHTLSTMHHQSMLCGAHLYSLDLKLRCCCYCCTYFLAHATNYVNKKYIFSYCSSISKEYLIQSSSDIT